MLDSLKTILVIFLVVKFLFAVMSISLVRKYLKDKPLGQQTLFDLTVGDFGLAVIAGSFIYTLILITGLLFKPVMLEIGIGLTHLTVICSYNSYMCLLVVLTIRYLSIYHPSILDGSDDITVTKMLRCFIGITVLFLYVVELLYRPNRGKPGLFTSYTTGIYVHSLEW